MQSKAIAIALTGFYLLFLPLRLAWYGSLLRRAGKEKEDRP